MLFAITGIYTCISSVDTYKLRLNVCLLGEQMEGRFLKLSDVYFCYKLLNISKYRRFHLAYLLVLFF